MPPVTGMKQTSNSPSEFRGNVATSDCSCIGGAIDIIGSELVLNFDASTQKTFVMKSINAAGIATVTPYSRMAVDLAVTEIWRVPVKSGSDAESPTANGRNSVGFPT
jgi:hypothetical protein